MFIWRGFGIAVLGITFAVALFMQLSVDRVFADASYYETHGWPKLVGLVLAAALVWLLSTQLDKRPGRVLVDKATGQELTIRRQHDFFFVPLRYWPAILLAAGIALFLFG